MKKIPKISVIVPVYNVEMYLCQCIESVINQTFCNFELILVDDGSEDESKNICDKYKDKDARIKVIHKINEGPTMARMVGAKESTGEYLIFLDSDDYFDLDVLRRINDIITKYKPDSIIFEGIRFGGDRDVKYQCLLGEGFYFNDAMQRVKSSLILDEKDELAINYGVCMKVFRREHYLIYQNMVPSTLYKGEDLAVIVPLLANCNSVYVLNLCGYYYRDTPDSIMNSFRPDELEQIKILAAYLSQVMDSFYQSRIDNYVVLHIFDYLSRAILKVRSYKEYRRITALINDKLILDCLHRAKSNSLGVKNRLIFFVVKYRLFFLIYLIRKIRHGNKLKKK